MGAEQNHLWPVSRKCSPSGTARVVLARTSDPPCFSVMAMPNRAPGLSAVRSGLYCREYSRGSQSPANSGAWLE